MIDKKRYDSLILNELKSDDLVFWLDYKKSKFLHNIDTLYYSVKFSNDFRSESVDDAVLRFRNYFRMKYEQLQKLGDSDDFYLPQFDNLVLKFVTFARFYSICFSYPEYFDIFIAPIVPKGADGGDSVTCELVVQLRSYFLWQFGPRDCFENSYEYVKKIAGFFNLNIVNVQENRVDYCWHSNYFSNPESFFAPDNFYKMRVDRFKNATYVTNKVGSENYEIDYVALGKRSDKVFIRIYQKTREVIELNYKPWFLQVWKMNGLINNYDLYVYERAFKKRSWFYRYYARLEFYVEYGSDPEHLRICRDILSGDLEMEEDSLIKYVDRLTPHLNYVINVEYQTMRRHTKSYELVPFKDHSNKGETKRIYDFLDNRKLIIDYLTDKTFRLVNYDPNIKKSDREMCAFWVALRRTRCLDMRMTSDEVKLVRNYNRHLNKDAVKKRFVNAAVTYGLYSRGLNSDSPVQDAFEAMLCLNDNDLHNARKFKTKKLRQLNAQELAEVFDNSELHRFRVLDESTGVLYDYNNLNQIYFQGDNVDDYSGSV